MPAVTGFELDRALAERRHATTRVTRRYAVREWTPVRQAHELPIPDPRQPVDKWQRDATIVMGAAAFLLAIATVATLLNPVAA